MAGKKTKKSEAPKVVEVVELPGDNEFSNLSEKVLLARLVEKLSTFDAEMILSAAMSSAGIARKTDECFRKKEAREICLELIKRGGPAFSVGTVVYREFVS